MEEFSFHGVNWIRWGGVVLFLTMEILKNQRKKVEKKKKLKNKKVQKHKTG
jgi:hypothetical protein